MLDVLGVFLQLKIRGYTWGRIKMMVTYQNDGDVSK